MDWIKFVRSTIVALTLALGAVKSATPMMGAEIFWTDPISDTFVYAYAPDSFGDPIDAGSTHNWFGAPHLRVEGRFEPGDDAKLVALLREKFPPGSHPVNNVAVVSFHSTGGDFYEGLRISDTIGGFAVSTFVGPGDVCLSSCAIAFLGGQQVMTRNNPPWPSRYLHSEAVVGFHAPFSSIPVTIPIPFGTPLSEDLTGQLANSFYGQAQAAINEIAARMTRWNLSPDFVFAMLGKDYVEDDPRPIDEQYVLINSYRRLLETSSILLTDELVYPAGITIDAAENACHFVSYVNSGRPDSLFAGSLDYEAFVNSDVIAEGRYVDQGADGRPIFTPIATTDEPFPRIDDRTENGFTYKRLVPGADANAFFFDGLMQGLGPIQCSVFPFSDGRWYVKTFNENIHHIANDGTYGRPQGSEWVPTKVIDYDMPVPVSEFMTLGGPWIGAVALFPEDTSGYPEDIRSINAASFGCDGQLDPAAAVICDYPELAAADGRLGALYRMAINTIGPKVREDQRQWLAVRNRACKPEQIDLARSTARNDLARCLMRFTSHRNTGLMRQISE